MGQNMLSGVSWWFVGVVVRSFWWRNAGCGRWQLACIVMGCAQKVVEFLPPGVMVLGLPHWVGLHQGGSLVNCMENVLCWCCLRGCGSVCKAVVVGGSPGRVPRGCHKRVVVDRWS